MKSETDYKHTALCDMSSILATIAGVKSLLESSDASLEDEKIAHALALICTAEAQVAATRATLDRGIARDVKVERAATISAAEIERIRKSRGSSRPES